MVTAFLQLYQVTRMNWPARSPDMAPIEHLWDILGRRVHDSHLPAVNLAQLFQFLQLGVECHTSKESGDTSAVHEEAMH